MGLIQVRPLLQQKHTLENRADSSPINALYKQVDFRITDDNPTFPAGATQEVSAENIKLRMRLLLSEDMENLSSEE